MSKKQTENKDKFILIDDLNGNVYYFKTIKEIETWILQECTLEDVVSNNSDLKIYHLGERMKLSAKIEIK